MSDYDDEEEIEEEAGHNLGVNKIWLKSVFNHK